MRDEVDTPAICVPQMPLEWKGTGSGGGGGQYSDKDART